MTAGSQPHGARWPWFSCVQMTQTVSLVVVVVKKVIMSILAQMQNTQLKSHSHSTIGTCADL